MRQLQLPVANDWQDVETQLAAHNLSYLPLRHFCEPLHDMLQLRPLLGLRSPVNTLTRMLNPLQAPASLQSIFHPAYGALHQQADLILGQPRALVFKGDSGEVEIKPQADTRLQLLCQGEMSGHTLPRSLGEKAVAVHAPAVEPLRQLWQGEAEDRYGLDALLATTAVALLTLEPGISLAQAGQRAQSLWEKRNRESLN
jgi:anthranilate phosphoribosyltransferase